MREEYKTRLIRALALLFFALAWFPGCGGKKTRPANAAADDSAQTLEVVFLELSPLPRDLPLVEDAVSRLVAGRIGMKVHLRALGTGLFLQEVNSMLASGTPPDLLYVGGDNFSPRVNRGQLRALDGLLAERGQDIARSVNPVYLRAGRVKGVLYGIPSLRDMAADFGIIYRADLASMYGIEPARIKNLDDLETVLARIHRKEPKMIPLISQSMSGASFYHDFQWDGLGDDIGILPNLDGSLRLVNLFDEPDYASLLARMRRWHNAGYLDEDAAIERESVEDQLASGQVFAATYHQKPGFSKQESRIMGYPIASAVWSPAVATTDQVNIVMWGIPVRAAHPEAAMDFLNLLYADRDLVNLLDWGIEGRHWIPTGQGTIDFPSGITGSNSGYAPNHGWLFGNQFLSSVFNGDDPDLWILTERFNRKARKSPALGFSFDPKPVRAEYTAVKNVLDTYRYGLETGVLDPAVVLGEFRLRLRAAGIERVIGEKQKQLLEWARKSE